MKLTYTVNAKLPTQKAHGTQIAKMCEAFASQDLKLTLYLPSRKQTNDSRKHISIYDYYSVGKNFQIRLLLHKRKGGLLPAPRNLKGLIRKDPSPI